MNVRPKLATGFPSRLSALALGVLISCVPAAGAWAVAPCEPRALDFGAAEAGWRHVPMSRLKRDTAYSVETRDGRAVLTARADGAASLFVAPFPRPMRVPASLSWSWKTDALVPGADSRDSKREDAPLRVVVAFDGDAKKLPAAEQRQRAVAERFTGRTPPYAALVYVWSNGVPPEAVIPSAHTSQIRMLVVAAGSAGLGSWHTVQRDLAADYRRAFGTEPGPVVGVAVMNDTDNTGAKAVGQYADLQLRCGAR